MTMKNQEECLPFRGYTTEQDYELPGLKALNLFNNNQFNFKLTVGYKTYYNIFKTAS